MIKILIGGSPCTYWSVAQKKGREVEAEGLGWGGDWRSFPDRPHFQWDGGGKYTSSMVRAGRYPPPMPRFEEEETMMKVRNLGRKSLEEVINKLAMMGLSLADDDNN